MPSVTQIRVRYKDTVAGLGHEGRCDAELAGTL